jgi:hypothetical protein
MLLGICHLRTNENEMEGSCLYSAILGRDCTSWQGFFFLVGMYACWTILQLHEMPKNM